MRPNSLARSLTIALSVAETEITVSTTMMALTSQISVCMVVAMPLSFSLVRRTTSASSPSLDSVICVANVLMVLVSPSIEYSIRL